MKGRKTRAVARGDDWVVGTDNRVPNGTCNILKIHCTNSFPKPTILLRSNCYPSCPMQIPSVSIGLTRRRALASGPQTSSVRTSEGSGVAADFESYAEGRFALAITYQSRPSLRVLLIGGHQFSVQHRINYRSVKGVFTTSLWLLPNGQAEAQQSMGVRSILSARYRSF